MNCLSEISRQGPISGPWPTLTFGRAHVPLGIATIDAHVFIVTAMQFAEKPDDAADHAGGYADVFDAKGHLIQRFAAIEFGKSRWAISEYLRRSKQRPLGVAREAIR